MAGKMPRGGTGERTPQEPSHAPNHRTEKQCQREHEKAIGDQIPTGDSVRLTCEEIAIAMVPLHHDRTIAVARDHCDEDRANPRLSDEPAGARNRLRPGQPYGAVVNLTRHGE